jgi:hypothetical protein
VVSGFGVVEAGDMSPEAGMNRARSIALEIANSSSRYKDQARRLPGELGL